MSSLTHFPIEPDMHDFTKYTTAKNKLATTLRQLQKKYHPQEIAVKQLQALSCKLAKDSFTLAVLGQFKRGKSSLLNAILGKSILPTGLLPLTSAITTIRYGTTEKLVLYKENSIFPQELPLKEIASYITETNNPSNSKHIQTACLELPVPFLRYGTKFVDTPGIGSMVTANTQTTYTFLPQCDAALFVTSTDAPLNHTEMDFLHEIKQYTTKIFFILNKTDLLSSEKIIDLIEFIQRHLQQEGFLQSEIFPLSAEKGLQAKQQHNPSLYQASGLQTLEERLINFLSREKNDLFLQKIACECEKIKKQYDPSSSLTHISVSAQETTPLSILPPLTAPDILRTGLPQKGCPACQYLNQLLQNFLAQYQYQLCTQPDKQKELAENLLICPQHLWKLKNMMSPYGAALSFSPLAEQIYHKLYENMNKISPSQMNIPLPTKDTCFICQWLHQAESIYLRELVSILQKDVGRQYYQASQGLCLPHLQKLIQTQKPSSKTIKYLLASSAKNLQKNTEDMLSFALKHETLQRSLQNDNEREACQQTIIQLAGENQI